MKPFQIAVVVLLTANAGLLGVIASRMPTFHTGREFHQAWAAVGQGNPEKLNSLIASAPVVCIQNQGYGPEGDMGQISTSTTFELPPTIPVEVTNTVEVKNPGDGKYEFPLKVKIDN